MYQYDDTLPSIAKDHGHLGRTKFYNEEQQKLRRLAETGDYASFHERCLFINHQQATHFPLPQINVHTLSSLAMEGRAKVDKVAHSLMPPTAPPGTLPLLTTGDGNCFPRSASFFVFGEEGGHVEMRVRLSVAMALNEAVLLDEEWAPPFEGVTLNINT